MKVSIEATKLKGRALYLHQELMNGECGNIKVSLDLTEPPSHLMVGIKKGKSDKIVYSIALQALVEAVANKHESKEEK